MTSRSSSTDWTSLTVSVNSDISGEAEFQMKGDGGGGGGRGGGGGVMSDDTK